MHRQAARTRAWPSDRTNRRLAARHALHGGDGRRPQRLRRLGRGVDWVRDTNRKLAANDLTAKTAATELANWEYINSVLGIESVEEEAPPEIAALAEERQAARKAKNFTRSDQIRDELAAQGWIIEDTPKGPESSALNPSTTPRGKRGTSSTSSEIIIEIGQGGTCPSRTPKGVQRF